MKAKLGGAGGGTMQDGILWACGLVDVPREVIVTSRCGCGAVPHSGTSSLWHQPNRGLAIVELIRVSSEGGLQEQDHVNQRGRWGGFISHESWMGR